MGNKRLKREKRNLKKAGLLAAFAVFVGTAGIGAYFSDGDVRMNPFTVGKVSLKLTEPHWKEEDGKNITPCQEIAKDPQITNDGINEEYVFLKVTVPYRNIITANGDGTKNLQADTELFSWKIKEGWTMVSEPVRNENNKTVTYLYAYGSPEEMTKLKKGETTVPLFDHVKFVNLVEDQNLESVQQDIKMEAYGIQTENINDQKDIPDGNNADGMVTPEQVWAVINNQIPSTGK